MLSVPQEEESERKRHWEMDQQKVASKMEELQSAKVELEQEVDTHKTRLRLHMEAQATRRAMDDHGVRQAKVVEALEAEKRKIGKDLEEMQRKVAQKGSQTLKNGKPLLGIFIFWVVFTRKRTETRMDYLNNWKNSNFRCKAFSVATMCTNDYKSGVK